MAYIARVCGAGDRTAAKKAVSQAVLAVLTAGTFFTVLTLSLSGMVPVWMQVDEDIQALAAMCFFILYAYYTEEYIKDMGTPERRLEVENDLLNGRIVLNKNKSERI